MDASQAVLSPVSDQVTEQPPLFQLQAVTVRYDRVEDRIAFNAADAQGAKQIIYFTRRLLDQMIPTVVAELESRTPAGYPADLMQSMSQARARLARTAGAQDQSVVVNQDTVRWLCHTVRLRKAPAGLLAILHGARDGSDVPRAVLAVTEPEMRVVLEALFAAYRKAGWSQAVFPQWMIAEGAIAQAPGPGARLN